MTGALELDNAPERLHPLLFFLWTGGPENEWHTPVKAHACGQNGEISVSELDIETRRIGSRRLRYLSVLNKVLGLNLRYQRLDVGRILGIMPHPERAADATLGSDDGLAIFKAARAWFERA